MDITKMALLAKKASIKLSGLNTEIKNNILKNIANELNQNREKIFTANNIDLERSKKENIPEPILKRLVFNETKLDEVISGLYDMIKLEDPVGKTLFATELDKNLELYKVSCPIGVIGIIFESRPDALVQISSLCLKSGNSVILKGGREALETNKILYEIIKKASSICESINGWIGLLETREEVNDILKLDESIDLIIPRGSNSFVRYIIDNTRIPVLGHADGICHCYIDNDYDKNMAIEIIYDSKTQYVAVCNALETLLIHEDIANALLPELQTKLQEKSVKILGCEKTTKIINCANATKEDWQTEYLDYIISIKIVTSIDEAIDHINTYGSGHTDTIVTNNKNNAEYFMNYVDSGNVFWNCSTRFSDGIKYGFGAEVGISTNKIHSRGPVGLDGLVIYKYKLIGNGHIVKDYAEKKKTFNHKSIELK